MNKTVIFIRNFSIALLVVISCAPSYVLGMEADKKQEKADKVQPVENQLEARKRKLEEARRKMAEAGRNMVKKMSEHVEQQGEETLRYEEKLNSPSEEKEAAQEVRAFKVENVYDSQGNVLGQKVAAKNIARWQKQVELKKKLTQQPIEEVDDVTPEEDSNEEEMQPLFYNTQQQEQQAFADINIEQQQAELDRISQINAKKFEADKGKDEKYDAGDSAEAENGIPLEEELGEEVSLPKQQAALETFNQMHAQKLKNELNRSTEEQKRQYREQQEFQRLQAQANNNHKPFGQEQAPRVEPFAQLDQVAQRINQLGRNINQLGQNIDQRGTNNEGYDFTEEITTQKASTFIMSPAGFYFATSTTEPETVVHKKVVLTQRTNSQVLREKEALPNENVDNNQAAGRVNNQLVQEQNNNNHHNDGVLLAPAINTIIMAMATMIELLDLLIADNKNEKNIQLLRMLASSLANAAKSVCYLDTFLRKNDNMLTFAALVASGGTAALEGRTLANALVKPTKHDLKQKYRSIMLALLAGEVAIRGLNLVTDLRDSTMLNVANALNILRLVIKKYQANFQDKPEKKASLETPVVAW